MQLSSNAKPHLHNWAWVDGWLWMTIWPNEQRNRGASFAARWWWADGEQWGKLNVKREEGFKTTNTLCTTPAQEIERPRNGSELNHSPGIDELNLLSFK